MMIGQHKAALRNKAGGAIPPQTERTSACGGSPRRIRHDSIRFLQPVYREVGKGPHPTINVWRNGDTVIRHSNVVLRNDRRFNRRRRNGLADDNGHLPGWTTRRDKNGNENRRKDEDS